MPNGRAAGVPGVRAGTEAGSSRARKEAAQDAHAAWFRFQDRQSENFGGGLRLRNLASEDLCIWGASPQNLVGIDLLSDRISEARSVCPPAITLRCQNATDLADLAGDFDLVLQSTVFTSILDHQMKRQIASGMLRKLRADGIIVWYDFHVNNPANPDVRGIGRSEIHRLFPDCRIHLEKLTLAPPLGRPIARVSQRLYRAVSAIKPLCTHYLGIIRKV